MSMSSGRRRGCANCLSNRSIAATGVSSGTRRSEAGGILVGHEVRIEIEVQAVKAVPVPAGA